MTITMNMVTIHTMKYTVTTGTESLDSGVVSATRSMKTEREDWYL